MGSWTCAAESADGGKLLLGAGGANSGNPIYISPDSGATWVQTSAPAKNWVSIARSLDGERLVAAAKPDDYSGLTGAIYSSVDSGLNWVSNNVSSTNWSCVTSSADGCKLAATVSGGGIYTLQTTPAPVLNISSQNSHLLLSWPVPSQPFVLQQSQDLTTWGAAGMTPVLNYTNLHYEVSVSPVIGPRFFRLASN
jgi:hypothetical protein